MREGKMKEKKEIMNDYEIKGRNSDGKWKEKK